ncbi:TetR/AcrR family transcriptional regulator [Pseudonocardia sp. GCM10023141]|uniref:TetR/AcrR family transcriptional regulator n=1 Tax=Pseudonocardia sp. GCM10023141 TaxID=3252653 RepID=UPI003620F004
MATAELPDRRGRRRQETIEEILRLAVQIMETEGVGGLTVAEIARGLGVRPPSIYKYFSSLRAIHDTLFQQGHAAHRDAVREALHGVPAGMTAVLAAAEATGRWATRNPVLAELMFWRPVPGFRPSDEAFAPSRELYELLRATLGGAVDSGELGPGAATDRGVDLLSCLVGGVMSQHMANEPGTGWNEGRFTPLLMPVVALLPHAFPPPAEAR